MHLNMVRLYCPVSVRHREQFSIARHSQREPTLLGLAVSRIEDGQRKRIDQHGSRLREARAVFGYVRLRLG